MWWRLAGVWSVVAIVCVVPFTPIPTHAVKLVMPTGANMASVEQSDAFFKILAMDIIDTVLLALVVIPILLSWRIIRYHKRLH